MSADGALPPVRERWRSRTGFVLSSLGAAVGLGNLWRFSYVAGENGGATFLLVYLLCVALLGLPLVIAEAALGRRMQTDAVAAFAEAAPGSRWYLVGGLGVAASFVLLGYYAVVAGWALKYFVGSLSGALWRFAGREYGGYFASFIADPVEPVLWQLVIMAATVAVVAAGVERGIERANAVLMPGLAVLVLGLALYSVTLEGAERGLAFLFAPDWSALARPRVYLAAMGQAFFSIGVGMSLFVTYGSYLAREHPIPLAAAATAGGDTLIAIVAGVAIFPAVFAFGLDPAKGPELAFITLPQLFLAMPGGRLVGPVFFLLLTAAALTSMVSMLEVAAAFAMRRFRLSRRAASAAAGAVIFLIGVPAALGYGALADLRLGGRGVLDLMDFAVSNIALPLGALGTALFAGWRWNRAEALSESDLGDGAAGRAWRALLRYLAPVLILAILVGALGLV